MEKNISPLNSDGFFSIHIDTISVELPILYFKGSHNYDVLLSLKVVLILANSADSDEMQQPLGLPCLPKYPFRGFQYKKVMASSWEITTVQS